MREQIQMEFLKSFPNLPKRIYAVDWDKTAEKYSSLIFDTRAPEKNVGDDLPLCCVFEMDCPTSGGYQGDMFYIPSYIGMPAREGFGEALTCLGAVLGALTAGESTKRDGHDFAQMAKAYYSIINGHGVVTNNVNAEDTCGSFWYDIFPSILYTQIASFFPEDEEFMGQVKEIAKTWSFVADKMKGDWEHTGYSLKHHKPLDSGRWIESDAMIGIAYLCYISYTLTKDSAFLLTARQCLEEAAGLGYNPYYEILGSFGPYIAARMNAEEGTDTDMETLLQIVFSNNTATRTGWGVIREAWGDYDAYGLSGSSTDTQGYAFSMNTYVNAAAVAPVARYSQKYAKAIGRYLMNVLHNAKLFLPDTLPAYLQNNHDWVEATGISCISYEGVRNQGKTVPYGTGDQKKNFNPYGAWGVGLFAALFKETTDSSVLCADLTGTEYYAPASYQTYLFYNGADEDKAVSLQLPAGEYKLYDTCTGSFVEEHATGLRNLVVKAHEAAVIVVVPCSAVLTKDGNVLSADGIPIDYAADGWSAGGDIRDVFIDRALNAAAAASSCLSDETKAENVTSSDWHDYWTSGENPGEEWLLIDLGSVVDCNLINIYWNARDKRSVAESYYLEVSVDKGHWEKVYRSQENERFYQPVKMEAKSLRYIRIVMEDKEDRAYPYSINDIQVF